MAVTSAQRRVVGIMGIVLLGGLMVWLFLRFIVFGGSDSPANLLQSGDFIRLKNTQTGKYLTLCSFYNPQDPTNTHVSQPVVAVTADGEADDPNSVWEVFVQPVKGSSYGEKVVAFRTASGCDFQTCAQAKKSGGNFLPLEGSTGVHKYLFYDINSALFGGPTFGQIYQDGQVLAVADFNRPALSAFPNQLLDQTIFNFVPEYPNSKSSDDRGIAWFSLFWWPGVDKTAPGSVGFNVWTVPRNSRTGLGPVGGPFYGCSQLISGNLTRETGAAWTLEFVSKSLKPAIQST